MSGGEQTGVVAKLCSDGEWCVLLMLPGQNGCERAFTPDAAERVGRELLEYAALVRDKTGLPGSAVFP